MSLDDARARLRDAALHFSSALVAGRLNASCAAALERAEARLEVAALNYANAAVQAATHREEPSSALA